MTAARYTLAELLLAIKQAGTDGALNIDQVLRLFEAHPEYIAAALRAAGHQPAPTGPTLIVKAVQPLPPTFADSAQHQPEPEHYGAAGTDWADVELFHDRLQAEPAPAFLNPPSQQPLEVDAPTVVIPRPVWRPPSARRQHLTTGPVDLDVLADVLHTGETPVQPTPEGDIDAQD